MKSLKSGQRRITFASICQSYPGVKVMYTPLSICLAGAWLYLSVQRDANM